MSKKKVFYVLSGAILGVGVILAIFILTFGINLNSGVYSGDKNVTEHKESNELKPITTGIGLNSGSYLDVGDDPESIEVVEVKQLTTEGSYSMGTWYDIPNWSPDGKYFVAIKKGGTVLFNENGEKIKELNFHLRDWSPDSKKIICEGMALVDVETGEKKKVIEGKGYDPAFLPSGDRIIYHSKDGLSIVDINTGEIETLIDAQEDNFSHIWYVSNDKIFYTRDKRAEFEPYLYRYNSVTKEEHRIFSYEVYGPQYLLTKTGKVLIGNSFSEYKWVFNENGEVKSKIEVSLEKELGEGWLVLDFDISPNGRLLLCNIVKLIGEGKPVKGDLYIYSLNGKKKKKITDTENEIESRAKWSPRGDKIIFENYYTDNIYLMTITKK